jgi:hypothetical protein
MQAHNFFSIRAALHWLYGSQEQTVLICTQTAYSPYMNANRIQRSPVVQVRSSCDAG